MNVINDVHLASLVYKETFSSGLDGDYPVKRWSTWRAQEFNVAPEKPLPPGDSVAAALPIVAIVVFVVMIMGAIIYVPSSGDVSTLSGAGRMEYGLSRSVFIIPLLTLIGYIVVFLYSLYSRKGAERYHAAIDRYQAEMDIYNRLRYIESENIVFDPDTQRKVNADKTSIMELMCYLADAKMKRDSNSNHI